MLHLIDNKFSIEKLLNFDFFLFETNLEFDGTGGATTPKTLHAQLALSEEPVHPLQLACCACSHESAFIIVHTPSKVSPGTAVAYAAAQLVFLL